MSEEYVPANEEVISHQEIEAASRSIFMNQFCREHRPSPKVIPLTPEEESIHWARVSERYFDFLAQHAEEVWMAVIEAENDSHGERSPRRALLLRLRAAVEQALKSTA